MCCDRAQLSQALENAAKNGTNVSRKHDNFVKCIVSGFLILILLYLCFLMNLVIKTFH